MLLLLPPSCNTTFVSIGITSVINPQGKEDRGRQSLQNDHLWNKLLGFFKGEIQRRMRSELSSEHAMAENVWRNAALPPARRSSPLRHLSRFRVSDPEQCLLSSRVRACSSGSDGQFEFTHLDLELPHRWTSFLCIASSVAKCAGSVSIDTTAE